MCYNLKNMSKIKIISFVLVLLSFVMAAILYPTMPLKLVSHWNAAGEPDGYMSKFWGLFLMPIISLVIFILFILLPYIDPLKKNYKQFRDYYEGFILLMIGFLFYVFLLSVFWNIDMHFSINQMLIPALAFMFYYSSILIEKAKMNWFVGIRTPWTLSSQKVWDKTHKLGGRLFKFAAAVAILGLLFNNIGIYFVILPVLFASVYLFIYSYLEYRKLK